MERKHTLAKARQPEVDAAEYAYWQTLTEPSATASTRRRSMRCGAPAMQEARFGVIVAGTRGRQAALIEAIGRAYHDSPMQRALRKAEAARRDRRAQGQGPHPVGRGLRRSQR